MKGGKRDRLRRLWVLATSSPAAIVLSLVVLSCAIPGLLLATGATISMIAFVVLLFQILFITLAPAGMLILAVIPRASA